jgi:nicotinate dehydrogenase subunit B
MHAAAAGPMANVTRGLAQVPDEDVRAIAVYVASLMADAPATRQDMAEPVDRLAEAQSAHPEAAMLFAGACAVCHEPGAPMMQQAMKGGASTMQPARARDAVWPIGRMARSSESST